MKKNLFFVAALACAVILTAGTASAKFPKAQAAPGQIMWAQQSPAPAKVRTPVAGYSPNFAAPQPATKATLTEDANRLIRWQGWNDVDVFSVSVLNQMQKQLGSGIEVGSFTIEEPEIAAAVATEIMNAKKGGYDFEMNPNLEEGAGANFEDTPTLFVWTYRHNFTDKGLYQLYISVKGRMDIGTTTKLERWKEDAPIIHKDIQALYYEFGNDDLDSEGGIRVHTQTVYKNIEIWRGAVVFVDHTGTLTMAGKHDLNPEDVIPGDVNTDRVIMWTHKPREVIPGPNVEEAPISDWERAPSLMGNPNYRPMCATGPAFVEPLERAISISENDVQKRAGDVQKRVRTTTPWRYR